MQEKQHVYKGHCKKYNIQSRATLQTTQKRHDNETDVSKVYKDTKDSQTHKTILREGKSKAM